AGDPDGHHLQNRSAQEAVILEIGARLDSDAAYYPDIDLERRNKSEDYCHKDGTPYRPRNRDKS
ncbi:MAG TPA: transcriptional regulator, partial [Burkholderiales bacterium]|nr:transcriptional regulator [Burkholderiales bacterium]